MPSRVRVETLGKGSEQGDGSGSRNICARRSEPRKGVRCGWKGGGEERDKVGERRKETKHPKTKTELKGKN